MAPKTGFLIDDQAPKADKWNPHLRWTGRDMANFIAAHVFGELTTGIGAGSARVLAGFNVSAGSGMASNYTAGAAIHYDTTVYTAVVDGEDTVSPFGWQMVESNGAVTHDANASGSVRVDLVCSLSTIGTDRPENVQQDGGATTSQNTRWGHQSSVAIVKGTPGAGAPATPTGYTLLEEVSIPDGAGSSAAFTYTDKRQRAANHILYDTHVEIDVEDGNAQTMIQVDDQTDATTFALTWNRVNDWMAITRNVVPAGDTTQQLYPMVVPGGREWTVFIPFAGGNWRRPTSGGGLEIEDYGNKVEIDRTGVTAEQFEWSASMPIPARGLEITAGTIYWDVNTAFDGTILNQTLNVDVYDETGASTTSLAAASPALAVAGTGKTAATSGTPVVVDGEYARINLTFGLSADGTAVGRVSLYGVQLTLKEGRV